MIDLKATQRFVDDEIYPITTAPAYHLVELIAHDADT